MKVFRKIASATLVFIILISLQPMSVHAADPVPEITSAVYNAENGVLVVTGNNIAANGSGTDIDASKFTITGEGGETYSFTNTPNAERDSITEFTLTLSEADKAAVNMILNKNGNMSTGGTIYNLAAADDWETGADPAVDIADLTDNPISVSSVEVPTITSATYDAATGTLTVTGTGFLKRGGAENDIDVSALTFTGAMGSTYTLTNSADVDISSETQFTVILSTYDKEQVNLCLDKDGTSSMDGTTYNLAAAEDWAAGADPAVSVADFSNGITVSNAELPEITSAVYNGSIGLLVVTGANIPANGSGADIDASKFTITGEGGETWTLTDSPDVERDSGIQVSVTLSATDWAAVKMILNKNGTMSTGGTTYNLAAAEDWATGADPAVNIADQTGNPISVSNVAVPTIISATYDAATGTLTVTGTGFLKRGGAENDIDVSKLTLTGEGGETWTLTDSVDAEIESGNRFSVLLSAADKTAVNMILNKNWTSATNGTTYNLAAAEDWAAGADSAVNVADLAGNGITVSNVAVPAITGATYDIATGTLTVTGTGFLKRSGAANDIDVSKLIITGEGDETYMLTDSVDVEITSDSRFEVVLSASDKSAVDILLNKNGTSSKTDTTYNLAAEEDWAAGADSAVNVADLAGNGITVQNIPAEPTKRGSRSSEKNNNGVEINGKKQNIGETTTDINSDGQRVTKIVIEDQGLDQLLVSSGERPVITLRSAENTNAVVGLLPGASIRSMAEKEAILEVRTENVVYMLPAAQMLDGLALQFAPKAMPEDIQVSISITEPSEDAVKIIEDTANKNNYRVVIKPVAFEILCTAGDKTIEVNRFNGYVDRTVAIPDGVDPSQITTAIVFDTDETFRHVPTTIVTIDGKQYVKISSMTNSIYAVLHNPVEFKDVEKHWAKAAINDLGSRLIITGGNGGAYVPERSITRAEFTAIMVRAMGLPQSTAESVFKDVKQKDWFCGNVNTAAAYGLINGYHSGNFHPNDTITREQAMVIVSRVMKQTGLKEGVITGTSEGASPKDYITRAEAAVMVQRLLQKSGLI